MRKILTLLAAGLCAAACIYPFDPELEETPAGILTVDGDITIGQTSKVRLGTLSPLKERDLSRGPDLSTARVRVEDDGGGSWEGTLYKRETSGYSVFTIPTEHAAPDRKYRLCIDALDATYVSDWSTLTAPPSIGDIRFSADAENVQVSVSVDGGADGTGYVLLSYEETWRFHVDYVPKYSVVPTSWRITLLEDGDWDYSRYWCWKKADNDRSYPVDYSGMAEQGITGWPLLSFPRTDKRNQKRYCVRVTAKTLSAASYRFLKHQEEMTDGGDNLFSPNPGELPGNLRCETDPARLVYGYALFTRAEVKDAYLDNRYFRDPGVYPLRYLLEKKYQDFYERGYRPLEDNPHIPYNSREEGPFGWGPSFCYDCIAAGGTQIKPSFWKEEEE